MAVMCVRCDDTGYVKRGSVYGFKGSSEDHGNIDCPACADQRATVTVNLNDPRHFVQKRERKGVPHTCAGQCQRIREAVTR